MGAALAAAAVAAGHRVSVVSGPVDADVQYPGAADVIAVESTEEMLAACRRIFPACEGLIAAAAPCDYRPAKVAAHKIRKTGGPLRLELVETPDIVAALAAEKRPNQWIVAFALETEDPHLRAMQKLERKQCDLIVVNGPEAIDSCQTRVEVLATHGNILGEFIGEKTQVARNIVQLITNRFLTG